MRSQAAHTASAALLGILLAQQLKTETKTLAFLGRFVDLNKLGGWS